MQKQKILLAAVTILSGCLLVLASPAFAQTDRGQGGGWGKRMGGPGIFGSVSTINGTTLTVTSKMPRNGSNSTTYTVDASSATVTKNGAASSVSNIAVGDTVMIQGTINGTNVAAKNIRDGLPQNDKNHGQNQNPIIQGNGQPVVAGSVASVSGNTITITNKSNITYTIDASNAKIEKGGASSSVSALAVGDNVIVQGTVNGNSITASSVIVQGGGGNNGNGNPQPEQSKGFMGGIVNFFKHLFGF